MLKYFSYSDLCIEKSPPQSKVTIINSISSFNPLADLKGFIERAKILSKYQDDKDFSIIKENATRVSRLLKDSQNSNLDASLFMLEEEKTLYQAILNHNQDKTDLDEYIKSLNILIKPIVEFFEKVLVMDKDEKIKNNRLALLNILKEKFSIVCDFEKL